MNNVYHKLVSVMSPANNYATENKTLHVMEETYKKARFDELFSMDIFLYVFFFQWCIHNFTQNSRKKNYLVATTFQYIFIYENDEIHIIYYNVVLVISVYIFYSNTDPHLKSLCIWKWFSLLYRYLLLCLNTLVVNKLYIKW